MPTKTVKPAYPPCTQGPRAAHDSGIRPAQAIKWVVIHSAEASDDVGEDRTAEGVANFFANPRTKASTQLAVDSDSCVRMVPDLVIPWGAPGANTHGLHVEICGRAAWTKAEWLNTRHKKMLDRAAFKVAVWCYQYRIPVAWVRSKGLQKGYKGLTTHKDCSDAFKGSDHWDPGPGFPAQEFLAMVDKHLVKIKENPEVKTPDLTLVQVIALVAAAVAIVLAVSLPLSEAHGWMIVALSASVAVALVLGDALIRFGRSLMAGNKFNDEDLGLD